MRTVEPQLAAGLNDEYPEIVLFSITPSFGSDLQSTNVGLV